MPYCAKYDTATGCRSWGKWEIEVFRKAVQGNVTILMAFCVESTSNFTCRPGGTERLRQIGSSQPTAHFLGAKTHETIVLASRLCVRTSLSPSLIAGFVARYGVETAFQEELAVAFFLSYWERLEELVYKKQLSMITADFL